MYCFLLTQRVDLRALQPYGKHTLIRIGDQPPLHGATTPPPLPPRTSTQLITFALPCVHVNAVPVQRRNFFQVVKLCNSLPV